MNKDYIHEANIVDFSDEDLKEYLGYTYHELKNLLEQQKNDPVIEEMKAKLKEYVDENYAGKKAFLKTQMKAARILAQVRGVKWKRPDPPK